MQSWDVWLETPWPSVYHDMTGLHLVKPVTRLRTQAKNVRRESDRYETAPRIMHRRMRVWYRPEAVRAHSSVLAAMSASCGVPVGDFRLPIPPEWAQRADALIHSWGTDKPIMICRPLVERTEWGGCPARNPDHDAYKALFDEVRDRFFVVSIADLEPGKEWMVGRPVDADVEYHRGELEFEVLAALFARAALVYCSPGFAVILAQATETPVVCVFGGYENSSSFSAGARFAPYLGIDPIKPCNCFSHKHDCDKRIDLPSARARITQFVADHCA